MIPKFRAWLKNDKKMIDVDEIHFDNGQLDFIGDAITFMREADEIELMQSTGLFDKIRMMYEIYLKRKEN